jgi:hypothetical protein
MNRRHFLAAVSAAAWAADAPVRKAKVVKLFKSPDGNPNALEATAEGLWIGEQCTDRAHLVDWKTGKTLARHPIPGGGGVHGLEKVTLTAEDPDPHGMCIWRGSLYYCDAGIAPGAKPTGSPSAGYVCRIDV